MHSTSFSLLDRLRGTPDEQSWSRFVELYTPLLLLWLKRVGVTEADVLDLVQDVFVILLREMPQFQPNGQTPFRAWLKTVVLNHWRNHFKKCKPILMAEMSNFLAEENQLDFIEKEYASYISRRALELIRTEFRESTWRACWEVVVENRKPEEVAAELGISIGAVYIAKSRVLSVLRQELSGLWD